jgi:hypothetical protein
VLGDYKSWLTKASICVSDAGVAVATIATRVDPFVATT